VIFLTSLSSERDRLLGYRLGVDDYVAKPHTTDDLLARTDRAVVRASQIAASEAGPQPDGLRGALEQVSLPSLLAFLEMERKTGVLRIGPIKNVRIYLSEGRPLRVTSSDPGAPTGLKLLLSLFDLTGGRFEFSTQAVECDDELETTVSGALLEHAKQKDDENRDSFVGEPTKE
jgi:hypothetical protein